MNFIWESVMLILSGILLLRLTGRKSISQMTLAQTIVMISIDTINCTIYCGEKCVEGYCKCLIFVISVVILEYLQLKSNVFEKFITGKPKIVIENGVLNVSN